MSPVSPSASTGGMYGWTITALPSERSRWTWARAAAQSSLLYRDVFCEPDETDGFTTSSPSGRRTEPAHDPIPTQVIGTVGMPAPASLRRYVLSVFQVRTGTALSTWGTREHHVRKASRRSA